MDHSERLIPGAGRAAVPAGSAPRSPDFDGPGFLRLSLMVNAVFGVLVAVEVAGARTRPLGGGIDRPVA